MLQKMQMDELLELKEISGSRYVVFNAGSSPCDNYRYNMLLHNEIQGIAQLSVKHEDGHARLYYNVSSMLSLNEFVKREAVSAKLFIGIMRQIAGVVIRSSSYLIDQSCFLISDKYIFIKPEVFDILLICIPDNPFVESFQDCFRNVLVSLAAFVGDGRILYESGMLHRLIRSIQASTFNIKAFMNELELWSEQFEGRETGKSLSADNCGAIPGYEPVNADNGNKLKGRLRSILKRFEAGLVRTGAGSGPEKTAAASERRKTVNNTESITFPSRYVGPALLPVGSYACSGRIQIDKPVFVIGRSKSQADGLINCNVVGRRHAELFRDETGYLIKDLDSLNGTMLNGVRIEEGKGYRVKDGDRLVFANQEYIFSETAPIYNPS